MGVQFGSVGMYEAMRDKLNADPEWKERGKKITYSMIYAYGHPVDKAFYCEFDAGQVVDVRELESADEVEADFVISGPAEVWKGVVTKQINPTAALTKGQLKLQGKMSQLLKNMDAFGHIIDTMTELDLDDSEA